MLKPQQEPTPTPLSTPKRTAQPLNQETAMVAEEKSKADEPAER
jgi:hypothetical protein